MRTYKVTTYGDGTYTVTLDDTGVVDVDGLLPSTAEDLKASVSRHMERRRLSPLVALTQSVGAYSSVTEEVDAASVTDELNTSAVT